MNNKNKKYLELNDEILNKINTVFSVYEIIPQDNSVILYGVPLVNIKEIYRQLFFNLEEQGYQFSIEHELGEYFIVISPRQEPKKRLWINIGLACATFFTTMIMAAKYMFGVHPLTTPLEIYKGLPFTIAIMTVLGAHEMGHYLTAKKRGMHTSLPYFIPFPNIIGTMGAVIQHKGPIPDRKALFDVGVSGPLVGVVVSVIVTIIGLMLPTEGTITLPIRYPPLFELLTNIFLEGEKLHPVAFAGWVGMLVTALNLIPAGQLDGGHMLRAILGVKSLYVSTVMPFLLMSLSISVTYLLRQDGFIWMIWGIFLLFFSSMGQPTPLNDEMKLDNMRILLGIITFGVGLLCFTLAPFKMPP